METKSVRFNQAVEYGSQIIPEGVHQMTPDIQTNSANGEDYVAGFQLDLADTEVSIMIPIQLANEWDASGIIDVL